MQQLFSTTPYKLNQLLEKIDIGSLGLPELQRPFVWKDAKVRDLFDSMMKGYPIGFLMIWDCPQFDKKKSIGVEAHSYPTPKEVIIDGQQRLTCLYAVIKGKKVYNDKYAEKEIIISYNPLENKFEVGCQATRNDKAWIYNISVAFATPQYYFITDFIDSLARYREAKGALLSEEEKLTISTNITALYNLTQYDIPVFNIKSDADEESVSDIFVRVNSGGTPLKQNDFILTLVSLYWQDGRKLIEKFARESTLPTKNTTSYNLITEVTPQDIMLAVIAYGFAKYKFKGSKFLFFCVVFTMVVPHQTIKSALSLKFRYCDIGVYNFGIIKLLTGGQSLNLLDTYWPMVILSLTGLAFKNGLYIFMLRQFFKGIPDSLEESAYIDGSGVFRTFVQIILPLSVPMLITVFLFAFSWQWTDNFYVSIFFPGREQYVFTKILTVPAPFREAVNQAGGSLFNQAIMNTCAIMIILPLVVVYLFCQRFLIQGIERSGITGE